MTDLRIGDARLLIKEIPDDSIDLCISSPPYFGLRDYGTGEWTGGNPDCTHQPSGSPKVRGLASSTLGGGKRSTGHQQEPYAEVCRECGATREDAQMGLEASPDEFIAALVDLYREIRRALKPEGVCFINIGDSYFNYRPGFHDDDRPHAFGGERNQSRGMPSDANRSKRGNKYEGIKDKDLIGIPWMLAFALRADGWYLRQEIIWRKPNPMPESVRDRCTKAHESLFLLTKSPRYHFDIDAPAWAELRIGDEDANGFRGGSYVQSSIDNADMGHRDTIGNRKQRRVPAGWDRSEGAHSPYHPDDRSKDVEYTDDDGKTHRNRRSVWTVASQPLELEMCEACDTIYGKGEYRELKRINIADAGQPAKWRRRCRCGQHDAWLSHFATYPPDLIEPCIDAACPKGGIVLDPFGGAGTTGLVADRLQRRSILFELNPKYAALARYRIAQDRGGGLLDAMEGRNA